MSAIVFPVSPTTGDFFSVSNKTWQWSGSTWDLTIGNPGYLPEGTHASKPDPAGVPIGVSRTSTDFNGRTVFTVQSISGVNTWVQSGPSVLSASGYEIKFLRWGGDATTGTLQSFGAAAAAVTGGATSFTYPADSRAVSLDAYLQFILPSCAILFGFYIDVSMDNSHWVTVGSNIISTSVGGPLNVNPISVRAQARLDHPLFTYTTASPNTLVAGSTVYVRLRGQVMAAGTNTLGAWVSGTTYALGDSVTNSSKLFVRKVAGAGTTAPASDATNWVEATGIANYQNGFGYADNWLQIVAK